MTQNYLQSLISLLALFSALNIFYSTIVDVETIKNSSVVGNFLFKHLSRDVIILLIFIIIFLSSFDKFIKEYIIRVFRASIASSSSMYSYFELLVLFRYLNRNDISDELLSLNGNKEKFKSLKKYIENMYSRLIEIAMLSALMLIFLLMEFYAITLIVPIGIVIYLIYKLFDRIKIISN